MNRTLAQIAREHPALTYEAEGYDEPDRSKWSAADHAAFDEATELLKTKVKDFARFQNFSVGKRSGTLRVRLQHCWGYWFTGVGYFDVVELDKI